MKRRAYASGKYVASQASKAEAFRELQLKPSFRVATIFIFAGSGGESSRKTGTSLSPRNPEGSSVKAAREPADL